MPNRPARTPETTRPARNNALKFRSYAETSKSGAFKKVPGNGNECTAIYAAPSDKPAAARISIFLFSFIFIGHRKRNDKKTTDAGPAMTLVLVKRALNYLDYIDLVMIARETATHRCHTASLAGIPILPRCIFPLSGYWTSARVAGRQPGQGRASLHCVPLDDLHERRNPIP